MKKISTFFLLIFAFLFIYKATCYSAEISSSSATPTEVNYFLAYPGILPDNPFYFIKAMRDKTVSLLINDNVKRAKFNLLTSDKRMFAGQLLIEKDKTELGLVTISKSNNYFHHSIAALQRARLQGTDTREVYIEMSTSIQKHIELMKKYERYFKKEEKDLYRTELKRMQEMEKSVYKELDQVNTK